MWLKFLALFIGIIAIVLSFYFEKKVDKERGNNVDKNSKNKDKNSLDSDDFDFEDFREKLLKKEEKSGIYDKEAISEDVNRIVTKKMVELNEFSEQLLENIETNHKEVMFLYDMLSKKEEELRELLDTDFEEKKESVSESILKTSNVVNNSTVLKNQAYMLDEEYGEISKNISFEEKEELNTAFRQNVINDNFYYEEEEDLTVTEGKQEDSANVLGDLYSEIVQMKNQGMNNIDISKELQLGTGEVNLILNLYKSKIV